jgi:large subunit ribosomal protein L9
MKVVFLQDVPNVARAGEMKEVADGYGRNYLIPRKLAAQADPKMMNAIEAQVRARARQVAQNEAEMTELAEQIDGKEITITARVGANERLYGSITAGDIIAELEKSFGIIVDKRKIDLENPIRELGSHEVPIRLTRDIIPSITVTVTGEESS